MYGTPHFLPSIVIEAAEDDKVSFNPAEAQTSSTGSKRPAFTYGSMRFPAYQLARSGASAVKKFLMEVL